MLVSEVSSQRLVKVDVNRHDFLWWTFLRVVSPRPQFLNAVIPAVYTYREPRENQTSMFVVPGLFRFKPTVSRLKVLPSRKAF